jgi:N-acetylglutamate synthase-like GNAT family acetyltransferase
MLAVLESARDDVPERPTSRPKVVANGHKARTVTSAITSKGRLTIRMARSDEAPAIVQLTNAIFRGKTPFSPASFASTRDVEQRMSQGKFLLAENEKEIVGYAYVEPSLEASRLELLAVTPSRQRAGIGSQLLEAAERLSSGMECLFMHLRVVNLHWETIRFCRRRGYVEFGIESLNQSQPISLHCHFVRMCKRLETDRWAF